MEVKTTKILSITKGEVKKVYDIQVKNLRKKTKFITSLSKVVWKRVLRPMMHRNFGKLLSTFRVTVSISLTPFAIQFYRTNVRG